MQPMLLQDYETDAFDIKEAINRLNDLEKHAHGDLTLGSYGPYWKGLERTTRLFVEPSKITLTQSDLSGPRINHHFEIAGSNKIKIESEKTAQEMLEFAIEQIRTALSLNTSLLMGRNSLPEAQDILETSQALANAAEIVIRHINPDWAPQQSVEIFLPGMKYPGRIVTEHGKKKLFSAPLEKAILAKLKPALMFQIKNFAREIVPVTVTSSVSKTFDTLDALEAWKVIGFDPGGNCFLKAALKSAK